MALTTISSTSTAFASRLLAQRIKSGIGGSAFGHNLPTAAPEHTVSRHPYWPQGHFKRCGSTGI